MSSSLFDPVEIGVRAAGMGPEAAAEARGLSVQQSWAGSSVSYWFCKQCPELKQHLFEIMCH